MIKNRHHFSLLFIGSNKPRRFPAASRARCQGTFKDEKQVDNLQITCLIKQILNLFSLVEDAIHLVRSAFIFLFFFLFIYFYFYFFIYFLCFYYYYLFLLSVYNYRLWVSVINFRGIAIFFYSFILY